MKNTVYLFFWLFIFVGFFAYLVCPGSSQNGKEDWDKIPWLNKLAAILIYIAENEIQSQQLADNRWIFEFYQKIKPRNSYKHIRLLTVHQTNHKRWGEICQQTRNPESERLLREKTSMKLMHNNLYFRRGLESDLKMGTVKYQNLTN